MIPPELLQKVRTPLSTFMASQHPSVSDIEYGLAQMIRRYRGNLMIGHNGGLPGQYSTLSVMPERALGLMLTLNDEAYGSWIWMKDALNFSVVDSLLGLEPIDWESFMIERRIDDEAADRHGELHSTDSSGPDLTGTYVAEGYGRLHQSLRAREHCALYCESVV